MNENETDRIAAMGNALRPDWPVASLRALLRRPTLANKTRRDMAVALAWVACESETKTPARVAEAGRGGTPPQSTAGGRALSSRPRPIRRAASTPASGASGADPVPPIALRPSSRTPAKLRHESRPSRWRGLSSPRGRQQP